VELAFLVADSSVLCANRPHKRLLLLTGQKLEKMRQRMQQHVRLSTVEVGAGKKVGADHLQTVAADLSLPSIMAAVSIACSITGIWLL
jgi:hypothetical protein